MPKKTKKEKILADYRKKLRIIQQQIQQKDTQNIIEKKEIPVEKKPSIMRKKPEAITEAITIEEKNLINYNFFHDLKKSLLLSFFLIALQFFLYFTKLIK